MLVAPIREDARAPIRGVVQLLNREGGPFDEEDEKYLVALATQLARALTLTTLRAAEGGGPGLVLQGPFNRIVGRSPELRAVYERVQLAAQTDATVLLRGETGTGKGLFARAIHVNSRRQARPFVTVDCTTLPAQLVESELFGHERGAFTSADRRVPGKVELAEGGTLFLDELGDLPPDIQGKLLRFLQERTFERVGGRADPRAPTCASSARPTATSSAPSPRAASARTSTTACASSRSSCPPLRARGPEDVETLARHFADVYAQRYGRPPPRFTPDALAALRRPRLARQRPRAGALDRERRRALARRARDRRAPSRRRATRGRSPRRARAEPPPAPPRRASVALPLGLSLDEATARYAEATVEACEGNKTEAAKQLGIGRNTLARLLRR